MIFIFFIIACLQCSVIFLLYSKVTQSHIHAYILFLILSCSIISDLIQFLVLYSRMSLLIQNICLISPIVFFTLLLKSATFVYFKHLPHFFLRKQPATFHWALSVVVVFNKNCNYVWHILPKPSNVLLVLSIFGEFFGHTLEMCVFRAACFYFSP